MITSIDPTNSFTDAKPTRLLEACGLIPYFFAEAAVSKPKTAKEAFDIVMEAYGWGFGQDGSGWGTVDEKGMYVSSFEDDEDMAPLLSIEMAQGITGYIYQYGITAIKGPDSTFIARID